MEPVPYSAIVDRPPLRWPGGARIALWVSPNVELYELVPPANPYFTAWSRVPAPPDPLAYGYRDYGNRVGFWRLLEVLDSHRVRATASLNVAVLEQVPAVRDAMVERDWAFMGHGLTNTRFLYGLSHEAERALYRELREITLRTTGKELRGLFGPHATLSPHTMAVMAEEGFLYACDWLIDDQPFPIGGGLVGVPYSFEVNDGPLFLGPAHEGEELAQRIVDQFDVLYEEGGRVMCIALHPFLTGRPQRIGYLDEALSYVLGHDGVWLTTADEIAQWYVDECL